MRTFFLCLGLAGFAGVVRGQGPTALAAAATKRVDPVGLADTEPLVITRLGARPGASTLVTAIIQRAVDRCHARGGGTVVIPAGIFVSGTIRLRGGVWLELEAGATLLGSTRLADYPPQPTPVYRSLKDITPFRALIYAENEENIGVIGQGTIDGRGAAFKWGGNDLDGRPRMIQFVSCRGVRVEGLHLRNSGMWLQHYLNCEAVQIRGLNIWNHSNHNNDMMDIDGCRQVTVSDCIGDTDDDGITLKSTGPAPCENVAITNCVVSSHCNAIKCGTESSGGFKNIVISNCVVKPSASSDLTSGGSLAGNSGISLEVVDGGTMDGVAISNLAISGTDAAIFVRLGNRARKYNPQTAVPAVGSIRNIRIENVVARGVGNVGSSITGLPGHRVENVTLSGVRIELAAAGKAADIGKTMPEKEKAYPEGTMWGRLPAYGFYIRHAAGVRLNDVMVVPAAGEPRPEFVRVDAE